MRGRTRLPFSKASSLESKLRDTTIQLVISRLAGLKEGNFLLKSKFDKLEPYLDSSERSILHLCKVLYCLNYKREMFLHLGVIVESQVNKVIDTYRTNNWRTPLAYTDAGSQNIQFDKFRKEKTLSGKADDIGRFDLFNHADISFQIKHKIQSFRFLRNYGGHSSSVNELLEAVIESQPDCDDEIEDAFKLINLILIAHQALSKNPPLSI